MAIAFRQTIQVENGEEICFEIHRDGTVIVSGASEVKLKFPYKRNENGIKFVPDGTQEKGNEFIVEIGNSLNSTWDFQVVLRDTGTLLENNPHALVIDIPQKIKRNEKATVYAQDGIGDWSKQFAF